MKKIKNIVVVIIGCISIFCFCISAIMIYSLNRSALLVGSAEYMSSKPFWIVIFVSAFVIFSMLFFLLFKTISIKFKTFKKVIAVVGIFLILIIIVLSIVFLYKHSRKYEEAQKSYIEIFDYVRKNTNTYRNFYEYQISTVDENCNYFMVDCFGNIQQNRDVVFKPFSFACIDTISFEEPCMIFYRKTSSYEIRLYCFSDNCVDINKMPEQWDALRVIDGCNYLYLKVCADNCSPC